jgi:hypothetical protein
MIPDSIFAFFAAILLIGCGFAALGLRGEMPLVEPKRIAHRAAELVAGAVIDGAAISPRPGR